ncbi:MAG: MogA/MoaB family molybdenum cofactor biosynthesis protein [Bacteroidales bacterium]|jgi:molybdenum cofactor synthesis domain-containing protein|nr:MogA/MoaB family molybdenum cofactor biosynthesis protein [Bacteroidales bacterium]
MSSKIYKIKVITLSDRAAAGTYQDLSGPEIVRLTLSFFEKIGWKADIDSCIIKDDVASLKTQIKEALQQKTDLIFTTGGTGIGPRDITVDVIKPMLHKEIPGIMEYIRYTYGQVKPAALLSRAVAGVIDQSLVFTLPGSPKAVTEYCSEIFKILEHTFYMLQGLDKH